MYGPSAEGYKRALEALEHYKTFRSERYRFKLIVDEVREAKSTEYQTVLLAFVNCLIISTPQLKVRNSNQIVDPLALKVSQFQNEFMKSLFLPKYEQKIVRIFALCSQGVPLILSYFTLSISLQEARKGKKFIKKFGFKYKAAKCSRWSVLYQEENDIPILLGSMHKNVP